MKKITLVLIFLMATAMVSCSSSYVILNDGGDSGVEYYQSSVEGEEYLEIIENSFISTSDMPVSTFSADVDTAAYSIIRNKLMSDILPEHDSVRIEEMLNYFTYDLDTPTEGEVIHVTKEISTAPWNQNHQLMMLGLKTEDIVYEDSAASNLVFLLDVSGSMASDDKLPLLQNAILMLVDELRPEDRISIVVYASSTRLILDGADGNDKEEIIEAVNSLYAGGSTAGGAGIQLAYEIAAENFIEGGNNRVILATDGDFNVGISNVDDLGDFIAEKRETNVFLSVFGFGTGNIKDNIMETLADKGNGSYHYIDSLMEAKKVFVNELGGTLVTVAKDVKLQIEFNPAIVKGYRLIGYENRILENSDFDNDDVDAGDMGAGHEVIVLYELILVDSTEEIPTTTGDIPDDLKYDGENYLDEVMTLSIRYKEPDSDTSILTEHILYQSDVTDTPSDNFIFATCVAEFGLILLDSDYRYLSSYSSILSRVNLVATDDYRLEFITLVEKAQQLSQSTDTTDTIE